MPWGAVLAQEPAAELSLLRAGRAGCQALHGHTPRHSHRAEEFYHIKKATDIWKVRGGSCNQLYTIFIYTLLPFRSIIINRSGANSPHLPLKARSADQFPSPKEDFIHVPLPGLYFGVE